MKELLQTFGYTLGIGIIVFFAVMIISRSGIGLAEKWQGANKSTRLEDEADSFVKGVERRAGQAKDFTDRVRGVQQDRKETRDKAIEKVEDGEFYSNDENTNGENDLYVEEQKDEPIENTDERPMFDEPEEYVTPTLVPTSDQRSVAVADDDKTYEIQLGVVSDENANIDNFLIVEDLGDIFAETIGNNKNRIILGDFEGKRAASLVLAKVKQRGLKDAFLVELKKNTPAVAITPPQKTTPKPKPTPTVRKEETGDFVVKLGVFSDPPTEKLTKLSTLGKIYLQAHPTNPNLNVVSLGVFNTKSQANEALSMAKKQSFSDAYIAAANSQLIDSNAGKGLYYLPDEFAQAPAAACIEQYVIQLSAAKRPDVGNFKSLLNMGNLFTEYDPAKDVSKVFVGPFDDKTTANQALQKIKAKGFHQAFVVDRTKY